MQTDKIHRLTIRNRVASTQNKIWPSALKNFCHYKYHDFSTVLSIYSGRTYSRVDGNLNSANNMKKGLSY